MKIPELLVPVGGPEQLRAAIANGADAVYMSGSAFNARLNADNFGDDEIAQAIDLAHEYGVRVHITQNTLVKTEEMEAALENAIRMYEYGADALIIQDRGLASAIKKIIPDMPLHMSTQGTVYDINGVREAVRAGFDRVILSRELSRDEIAKICCEAKRELNTEIEIFVHGAICICYSGQCHMSEFIGGRSGNRGACAQPCRLPYELLLNGKSAGASDYPLSPADMSLINHLHDISEMGAASLKIEGRMKSPEYVAIVASIYRKYLDRIATGEDPKVSASDMNALRQIFSRGSFTDAYFKGESNKVLMSDDIPKHQGIRIGELVSADRKRGHAFIKLESELSNGDGIEIRPKDTSGASHKQNGSAGGVITYIKSAENFENKKNKQLKKEKTGKNSNQSTLLKTAERGMTVEVGDIPALAKADTAVLRPGTPVYKISDAALNAEARASYTKLPQRVDIDLEFNGSEGERASLAVRELSEQSSYTTAEHVIVMSDAPLEKALKRPADEEIIKQRLEKTGGTPYNAASCRANINGEPVISAAELNAMRRGALEALTAKRVERAHRTYDRRTTAIEKLTELQKQNKLKQNKLNISCEKDAPVAKLTNASITLNLYMTDASMEHAVHRALELIKMLCDNSAELLPLSSYRINLPYKIAMEDNVINTAEASEIKLTACLPAISKAAYSGEPVLSAEDIERLKELCASEKLYGISAANPSQPMYFENSAAGGASAPLRIFFEESMNIYNMYTAERARAHGMLGGVVSHELRPSDMTSFGNTAEVCEFSVWGRIPLMYTEHCPAGSTPVARGDAAGKAHSYRDIMHRCCSEHDKKHYCRAGRYELVDRKGEHFPLVLDDCTCRCTIMSYRPVDHINEISVLKKAGINSFRINVFDENTDKLLNIIKHVR